MRGQVRRENCKSIEGKLYVSANNDNSIVFDGSIDRYIILHNIGKLTLGKQEDFQIKCKL